MPVGAVYLGPGLSPALASNRHLFDKNPFGLPHVVVFQTSVQLPSPARRCTLAYHALDLLLQPPVTQMAHDPKAVANFFLDCAKEDGEALTPMKLVKLVYLAHGWNLGLTKSLLITEHAEAWRYGPVVPSIYHDLKEFGNSAVTRYARWSDWNEGSPEFREPKLTTASDETLSILKQVWSVYKRFTARQLSALTHQPGTPWYVTWNDLGGKDRLGTDISDHLIEGHYADRVAKSQPAAS